MKMRIDSSQRLQFQRPKDSPEKKMTGKTGQNNTSYERYRNATNMNTQAHVTQINNPMGTHVNLTLEALKKKVSDFTTYDEAKAAFDEYYKKKTNIIY